MKQTIIGVTIAILAVIFALQNAVSVQIKFLAWSLNCSMALLLIIVLATGLAVGMLVLTPAMMRKNSTIKSGNKKIAELEKKLSEKANQKYK
ncbi:MAG: lipopolysaccharide assembly LapA domain-containing protein [Bacteroidia bacterium]